MSMIPYAAAFARLFPVGENSPLDVCILSMSVFGFTFRLPEACPEVGKAEVSFFSLKGRCYHTAILDRFIIAPAEETEFCHIYRLETESSLYQRSSRSFMQEYSRYVSLKEKGDDAEMEHALLGCSSEKNQSYITGHSQILKKLFSAACDPLWAKTAKSFSFGLSLSTPWICREYLGKDAGAFQRDFYERMGVSVHPVSVLKCDVLCFGNHFCPYLCPKPELLFSLMEKAMEDGLIPCAVFAPVKEADFAEVRHTLQQIRAHFPSAEIVANDPGTLREAAASGATVSAGPLLVRHRKDPRARYIPDAAGSWGLTEEMTHFLTASGITRLMLDGWDGKGILRMPASLLLPFYQTNTNENCPYCKEECGKDCHSACRESSALFPEHLCLEGRYNSLFGYDEKILTSATLLQCALNAGIDRLILEVLP